MSRKVVRRGKLIQGVGINDIDYTASISIDVEGTKKKVWRCPIVVMWRSMINRCYSINHQKTHPTYIGCSVCEEWLTFSNFKKWVDIHYREGWHLDKDLLVKGNKVYSPDTCCIVPRDVNQIVVHKMKGELPLGVAYEADRGKYRAMCKVGGKRIVAGRADDALSAHFLWVKAKILSVKVLREKYRDSKSSQRAMCRVEAELIFHLENKIEVKML